MFYQILFCAFIFIFSIISHELAHYITARFFGYKISSVTFGFGKTILERNIGETAVIVKPALIGACVDINNLDMSKLVRNTLIFLAGPLCNFSFALVLFIFGDSGFALFPLILSFLNLLPFEHTDGGKILYVFTGKGGERVESLSIVLIAQSVILILFLTLFNFL